MVQELSFPVDGLSCASCVGRAEKALAQVEGVESVSINLASKRARVAVSGDGAAAKLAAALAAAGYPAQTRTGQLTVDGMSCASCVGRVEKALLAQPGVVSARVNLAAKTAQVDWLDGASSAAALAEAVTRAGYEAHPAGAGDAPSQTDRHMAELTGLKRAALWASGLALPVFLLAMGAHLIPGMHGLIGRTIGHQTSWIVQFVLTTAILLGPGRQFYQKGIPALLRGAPEMNSLVALGTFAAWGYSTLALAMPGLFPGDTRAVYFEAAAVITALILIGRYLEARARGRAGAAIEALIGLQPRTAQVIRDGKPQDRPLAEIVVGDLIQIRPGERIAADGAVQEGSSFVDESMITGEPVPVAKAAGAPVVGGTVNGKGALRIRATAVGEDTVLAQIIRMVETAQGAKLPIQTLVDKVTGVFVPVVIAVAILTVLIWLGVGAEPRLALIAGVSVLIVACPCAMGLATPTSIMVGSGRAAELGVLFRKGDALQQLQRAQVIAFDKTGTLTAGRPSVTSFHAAGSQTRPGVLAIAARLEARSEHPIAQAIMAAAGPEYADLPAASDVQSVTGKGLTGTVGGQAAAIGTARFLSEAGIDLSPLTDPGAEIAARGETPVYIAIDGRAAAVLGVSDPLKPTSRAAIAALHDKGLKVAMITGDTAQTAARIAQDLDIDRVEAEVLPGEKATAIADLRRGFGPVAFVGDGINDAPALAEADVGIAIGTGTDVAIEAADIVLISGDLSGAVTAHDISRATMRNIRQNLFWAFAYNVALVPVAAGVLYPLGGTLLSPILAAGAMAFSSVFVLTNALRLRRIGPGLAGPAAQPGAAHATPAAAT